MNRAHIAIVVLAEQPYSEGAGDRADLRLPEADRELLARVRPLADRLVVVLVAGRPLVVTDEIGHIEREDVETIADVLNLSVADVYGVVSFYHDFRTEPAAAHRVALCRGEACQSVGAEVLYADTRSRSATLGDDVEVAEVFKRDLGVDTVTIGFGLPGSRAHAPNEWFRVADFDVARRTVVKYREAMGIGSSIQRRRHRKMTGG